MQLAVRNFAFDENLVRVVMRDDEPWFVAADVCRSLAIKNVSQAVEEFDADEKGISTTDTLGGEQRVVVLSEPGLYRLIFISRKPDARRFQRWVTHEVLPAIRKTGAYAASADLPAKAEPIPENQIYRLNLVREARLLFGADRARGLWSQLGLPPVPAAPDTEQDEARACLAHLLDHAIDGARGTTVRDLLIEILAGEDQHERLLMLSLGVRADIDRDAFIVANVDDGLASLYFKSPWRLGRWGRVLRRLPGCVPSASVRFGVAVRKGTVIPSDYLDAAFRMSRLDALPAD